MTTLTQTVMNALPSDIVSQMAGLLGETPSATTSGITAAVPALLAGALQQNSRGTGAANLLGLVNKATAGGNPLDKVGSMLSDERSRNAFATQGQGLAKSLLGGNFDGVTKAVTGATKMSANSVSTILAFLAPLVLGAIGRATGPMPTAAGVQSWLSNERGTILRALPDGLGSLFGLGGAASAAAAAVTAPTQTSRIMPWILGAIVLGLLAFFGLRTCSVPHQPGLLPHVTLQLPGGGSIDVGQNSIGYGVAKFLESSDPAPKTFLFDNLNFDTASNALTAESRPTVNALIAILKAYPNVRCRIVGYTDNQGDPAANQRLSEGRAQSVKQEFVNGGISADRIATQGMGEANPVADNATEEGRAENRRVEIHILKKK